MEKRLLNHLAAERERRGWTQARAALTAGISRQSYAAIEAGRSIPSTEVALRLARGMGIPVESLFRLNREVSTETAARWAGPRPAYRRRARIARIAGRLVARDASVGSRSATPADGVVIGENGDEVRISLFPDRPPPPELVVVGCDPAFGIVAELLRSDRGIEVQTDAVGSRAALEALARGEAHVAGTHLFDPITGEMNGPWIRSEVPFPCTRISFATWDQGLLLPPGNPEGISRIDDLARPGIRFLNREPGSGGRQLIDDALSKAGLPESAINGYATTASRGHFAVAEAIASGLADAGIGIRSAATNFGLEMLTLRQELYELVIPDHFLDLPAVGALLDIVRSRKLRAQIETLDGYDASCMGEPC